MVATPLCGPLSPGTSPCAHAGSIPTTTTCAWIVPVAGSPHEHIPGGRVLPGRPEEENAMSGFGDEEEEYKGTVQIVLPQNEDEEGEPVTVEIWAHLAGHFSPLTG